MVHPGCRLYDIRFSGKWPHRRREGLSGQHERPSVSLREIRKNALFSGSGRCTAAWRISVDCSGERHHSSLPQARFAVSPHPEKGAGGRKRYRCRKRLREFPMMFASSWRSIDEAARCGREAPRMTRCGLHSRGSSPQRSNSCRRHRHHRQFRRTKDRADFLSRTALPISLPQHHTRY